MRGVFLCFGGQKKFKIFFKKYFSNRIEKLHKMAFIYIFFFFLNFEKVEKTVFLGLILRFSNLNVLHKDLLLQDWVFRLGALLAAPSAKPKLTQRR